MEKLIQAHGNWVDGDRFWDREQEIARLTEYIDEGAHVLLIAQRRIGKTSLMREIARRIRDRYICLQVDLEKSESPADAVVELSMATHPHRKLWLKTSELFGDVIKNLSNKIESIGIYDLSITLRSGVTSGDWKIKGDQLFNTLAEFEKPVIVFFDEVAILVNRLLKGNEYKITSERKREVDAFMSWIRDNSIRHKEKVRIVIAGSIGIEPVLRQAGLSATLNTFTPFDLKPWEDVTALGCLEALAHQYEISFQKGACEKVIELLGCCIPHHVQMFFDHIYTECKQRESMSVDKGFVGEIYNTSMLTVKGHAELQHLEERLKTVLGTEIYQLALELLSEAALSGRLNMEDAIFLSQQYDFQDKTSDEVLREVLSILEHDGYLLKSGAAFKFVSNLLRDWWKAQFEFLYNPVSKRRK